MAATPTQYTSVNYQAIGGDYWVIGATGTLDILTGGKLLTNGTQATGPTPFTDSTGGTPATTLVLPRNDTTAHLASDVAANEASLNAQINLILTILKNAGLTT